MQNSVVNKLADAHSQINTEKAEARHSTAEIEALCDKLRLPFLQKILPRKPSASRIHILGSG